MEAVGLIRLVHSDIFIGSISDNFINKFFFLPIDNIENMPLDQKGFIRGSGKAGNQFAYKFFQDGRPYSNGGSGKKSGDRRHFEKAKRLQGKPEAGQSPRLFDGVQGHTDKDQQNQYAAPG